VADSFVLGYLSMAYTKINLNAEVAGDTLFIVLSWNLPLKSAV
jgi:hypothetical protein